MTTCCIGFGSNLGARRRFIHKAIELLKATKGIKVNRVSSIYETKPVGYIRQGNFLNGVLEIETLLRPRQLLRELHRIENKLGRKRVIKGGPRTIDLDILYYGEGKVIDRGLIIPHPRIRERQFVLRGLRELGKAR